MKMEIFNESVENKRISMPRAWQVVVMRIIEQ